MAIFKKKRHISQNRRNRKKRELNVNIVPHNSFYIYGTGKKYEEYLESPENRSVAGISIRQEGRRKRRNG